ncbi:hypothetical protein [Microbacterium sp. W4I20]|uniref:hypothetical protein n=1 Tax=Microbacterium sp. W4I20 TaxID=3042262 RepID=UPI00278463A2|nr:hypothetical protein [Microbacterium sp. W4I20]MDQ0726813.1 hypothetical protein [Microbacterium sp. W4I20]
MAVTPATIAVALGVAAPESGSITEQQWVLWIDDATMLIENRATQLDINLDDIGEAKLDYVVREAVVAQVKKPDDATQVSITVDDGTTSRSYRSGKGRVQILDEWWTLLGLTDPSGAFAIDMLGTGSMHLAWCNVNFGANWCSCGADIAGYPIFELDGNP